MCSCRAGTAPCSPLAKPWVAEVPMQLRAELQLHRPLPHQPRCFVPKNTALTEGGCSQHQLPSRHSHLLPQVKNKARPSKSDTESRGQKIGQRTFQQTTADTAPTSNLLRVADVSIGRDALKQLSLPPGSPRGNSGLPSASKKGQNSPRVPLQSPAAPARAAFKAMRRRAPGPP